MGNIIKRLIDAGYRVTNVTKKSTELEHGPSGKYLYLLPNKTITVVLDPLTVEADKELERASAGMNHNTSFKQFPARDNGGAGPITYGYAFRFSSAEEAFTFIQHALTVPTEKI
ncbi:UNVERIFIED_CONTAM: hypothetical protein N8J90_11965 [Halobacillus marinus]